MFASKLVLILNFHMNIVAETLSYLREARMETAALLSRVSYATDRTIATKQHYTRERLAKQTFLVKYVTESMRLSDVRILLDDAGRRARDQLKYMGRLQPGSGPSQSQGQGQGQGQGYGSDGRGSGGDEGMLHDNDNSNDDDGDNDGLLSSSERAQARTKQTESHQRVESLCRAIATVGDELTRMGIPSGSSTGPIGAMELKLSDNAIDDETVYNLMTVLREKPPVPSALPTQATSHEPLSSLALALGLGRDMGVGVGVGVSNTAATATSSNIASLAR